MTREEEIHNAAIDFAFSDKTETDDLYDTINDFYYGAKWADKTLLNKAVRWLEKKIDLYAMDTISAKSGHHRIVLTREFEEAFRQAMEGGVE